MTPVKTWFSRLAVVTIAAAAVCVLGVADVLEAQARPARKRPVNLVLITLDTTRADALGSYGAKGVKTPNLDRLAKEGVRFDLATACTPLTMPSHSTIMTGTWPATHGVRSNGDQILQLEALTLAEVLQNEGYATSGVVGGYVLKRMFGIAQGIKYFDDQMPKGTGRGPAVERSGTAVAGRAVEHLQRITGGPFFLWVHFYDPHFPYHSAKGHAEDSRLSYAEEIALVDQQVGKLLLMLKSTMVDQNTLVVVAGDHGEGLGDHGESEHGYLLFEPMIRVPVIMWAPGKLPKNKVVSERVRTVDLMPTMLDYLGVQVPSQVEGATLRPLIDGSGEFSPRPVFSETWVGHDSLGLAVLRSLIVDQWKYIDAPQPKLYNLKRDPGETNNLAAAEPQRLKNMRERLHKMIDWEELNDQAVRPAVELSDETVDALAALGYVASGGDDESAAVRATRAGADPAAHTAEIETLTLAQRYVAAGDLVPAEKLLRQLLGSLPDAPLPLVSLARVLRQLGREGEIEVVCGKLLEKHPDALNVRFFLARRMMREKRMEEAIAQLSMIVASDPDHYEAQLDLGRAYRGEGELEAALEHLEMARVAEPERAQPLIDLATVYLKLENKDEARILLLDAQALEPESTAVQRQVQRLGRAIDAP